MVFFFTDTATTVIYSLSLHDALPIFARRLLRRLFGGFVGKILRRFRGIADRRRSEEHTSELQSLRHLVCRLLLEKKKIAGNGNLQAPLRRDVTWPPLMRSLMHAIYGT